MLEYKYIQCIGNIVQGIGITGYLIEQSEIGIENTSYRHDKHHDDYSLHKRQRHISHLLPYCSAVNSRRFIIGLVNARYCCQINHHAVAQVFPHIHEYQKRRPKLRLHIPLMGILPEELKQAVKQSLIKTQERPNQRGYNNPGQEIRHEHRCLIYLCHSLVMQLPYKQRHRNRNHNVQYDKCNVIQNGIPQNNPDISGGKQEFKVIQADPVTGYNTVQESSVNLVLFKCDNNTEHRQKSKQEIPDCGWKRQHGKLRIITGPAPFLFYTTFLYSHFKPPFLFTKRPQRSEKTSAVFPVICNLYTDPDKSLSVSRPAGETQPECVRFVLLLFSDRFMTQL